MKIKLNILDASKAQDFLNYFIAALKERRSSPFLGDGSARFNEKGEYETLISDFARTNNGEGLAIEWKIVQNTDGTIPYLEVITSTDKDVSECSNFINEFTQEVLKRTLAQSTKPFFQRNYFCFVMGSNLSGEYWFGKKLRVAPLYPDDNSKLINAERIIVIDQIIEAIDDTHARQLADEQSIFIAARLSFLFDLGFYQPERELKWFINHNKETNKTKNKRMQTGIWDENRPLKMPKKREICPLSTPEFSVYRTERYFAEDLNFPSESRDIFRIIKESSPNIQLAFNRSCRLYQTALTVGAYSPTIKLSYLVGAVDAVALSTEKYKNFSEFIKKYYPGVDDKFLDFIHGKVRSSHWHGGDFILGENESNWKEFIVNPNTSIRFNIIRNGHKVIRTAILNWLFELKK